MRKKSVTSPIHPGEILLEEFMRPAGIGINGLGLALRATRISAIVNETRGPGLCRLCAILFSSI